MIYELATNNFETNKLIRPWDMGGSNDKNINLNQCILDYKVFRTVCDLPYPQFTRMAFMRVITTIFGTTYD